MNELFAGGWMIDIVIGVVLIELAVIALLLRRRMVLPLPALLAGLALLIAWRCSHAGLGWTWIALPLLAAGLAHGWDLWRRWPTA